MSACTHDIPPGQSSCRCGGYSLATPPHATNARAVVSDAAGLTDRQLAAELRAQIAAEGSRARWLDRHGLATTPPMQDFLGQILAGTRQASPKILRALGVRRVVRFYPFQRES